MTEQELDWIGRTFTRKTVTWRKLYEVLNPSKFEIAKETCQRYNRVWHNQNDGGLTFRDVQRRLSILARIDGGKYVEQKVVKVNGFVLCKPHLDEPNRRCHTYNVMAYRKRNGGEN